MSFESYTDCVFRAFDLHQKQLDIIKRKKEILDEVSRFHNFAPTSILFVGFSPAILAATSKDIFVTRISKESRNLLDSYNVKYLYISDDNLLAYHKKFDVVVALDEYFTYAESDNQQRDMVSEICNLAKEYVITTCKDYKNQEFKDREYSQPAIIKSNSTVTAFTEIHDWDQKDKNSFTTALYKLNGADANCCSIYNRRTLFFKQLAKFSMDAGADNFLVHKNLMYKSLIKKNYEHVISINFDN